MGTAIDNKVRKLGGVNCNRVLDYRAEIYGLATISIILYHLSKYVTNPIGGIFGRLINIALNLGNGAVDAFLFFSAIGLCASLQKNTTIVFYKNRIKRIVIPYLLVVVPYFIWFDFFYQCDGAVEFFLNLTTINCWVKGTSVFTFWYVPATILLYLITPTVYRAFLHENGFIRWALPIISFGAVVIVYLCNRTIFFKYSLLWPRIPIFLLGLTISEDYLQDKGKNYDLVRMILGVLVSIALLYAYDMPPFLSRWLKAYAYIGMIHIYAYIRMKYPAIECRVVAYLGSISLEVYLVHMALIQPIKFFDLWNITSQAVLSISFIIASFVFAVVVSKIQRRAIHGRNQD